MTTTPVATVNSAITRMATAMSPSTAPTRSSTSRTGIAGTVGKAAATAAATAPAAARDDVARRRLGRPGQRVLASVIEGALAVLPHPPAHEVAGDALAVHGRQAGAHDRRERGRDTAAGPRQHAREGLALVGLHVHEEEGRRLRPPLVVDLCVERI